MRDIMGAQWVAAMNGLIAHGNSGELYLFDAEGHGKRLEGPTVRIIGAQWVAAMNGLIAHGDRGEFYLFDAEGHGNRLVGPTENILGVQWVAAMNSLIAHGGSGQLFLEPAASRGRTVRRGCRLVRRTALDDCDNGPRHAGLTEAGGGRQSAQQFLPCPVAAGARGWEHRRRRTSTSFSPSRTRSRRARFLALGLRFNSMLSSVYTTLAGALLNVSKHAGVNVSRAATTIVSIPQPLADGHLAAGMDFGGMQRLGDVSLGFTPLDSSKHVRANASLAPKSSGSSLRPPTDGDLAVGADFYNMQLFANATRARALLDSSEHVGATDSCADASIDSILRPLADGHLWAPRRGHGLQQHAALRERDLGLRVAGLVEVRGGQRIARLCVRCLKPAATHKWAPLCAVKPLRRAALREHEQGPRAAGLAEEGGNQRLARRLPQCLDPAAAR